MSNNNYWHQIVKGKSVRVPVIIGANGSGTFHHAIGEECIKHAFSPEVTEGIFKEIEKIHPGRSQIIYAVYDEKKKNTRILYADGSTHFCIKSNKVFNKFFLH